MTHFQSIKQKLAIIAISIVSISSITIADPWTITTSSFDTRIINIETIDDKNLFGKSTDETDFTLPLGQFVEASRPVRVEKIKALTLVTSTGDKLVGKPSKIDGSNLIWSVTGIGDVAIPIEKAMGITKGNPEDDSIDVPHPEDEIHLANGDSVKGIVTAISEQSISITPTGGSSTDVPLDSVKTLYFAAPPQGRPKQDAGGFVLHLTSGAVIGCLNLSLKDSSFDVSISGRHAKIDPQQVAMIEHQGKSLNWLSSRKPDKIEYVPYFSGNFPPQLDKTVTGQPIQFGDTIYQRGIGMHSKTRLTWKLEPDDKTFLARYFIAPEMGYADVDVRVYVDDKQVHETKDFKAGTLSPVVTADLSNAKTLTLEVDYGKGYDIQDRVNWVEAAIMK